jgi:RNA polymerase sigma factor (sigma-70 family)
MASLVERWRAGDRAAGDELFDYTQSRLQRFAKQMLRLHSDVHAEVETADLIQQCCVRLIKALRAIIPTSMDHFRNLAYMQVRRELIDLAHSITRYQPLPAQVEPVAPGTSKADVEDLQNWAAFYEAVDQLSEEDRRLFDLRFSEGRTWAEIAGELGVHEDTARKRWARLLIALRKAVGNWMPPTDDRPA